MWVVQVQKNLMDLSKNYNLIHAREDQPLLTERNVFHLNKTRKKKLHSSSKIVSLRSQRFRGIQMYKVNCRVIYARAADLFVYGHSPLHMPDDIVVHYPQKKERLRSG